MKVGAVIQARLDSTRLCHKVFREINGHLVLDWVLLAAQQASRVDTVVVVTPDMAIHVYAMACTMAWGELHGLSTRSMLWRQNYRDPLAEYFTAAVVHNLDVIVRLTADCPMLTGEIIDKAVAEFLDAGAAYGYNHTDGADVEVFTFAALGRAYREAGADEREHVTTWIRRHLPCIDLESPAGAFLSLDTIVDYRHIQILMGKAEAENVMNAHESIPNPP